MFSGKNTKQNQYSADGDITPGHSVLPSVSWLKMKFETRASSNPVIIKRTADLKARDNNNNTGSHRLGLMLLNTCLV